MADAKSFIRRRLEPITLVSLLLVSTVYLLLNGEAHLGPKFGQYKDPLLTYLVAFLAFYILLRHRGEQKGIKKWQWSLSDITVLDTAPAIFAGVSVTFLVLILTYSMIGGGSGKSFGDMLVYVPYAIVAATIEEFMFRVVMLRAAPIRFKQQKHRDLFAEVSSSITFGMFHYGVALMWFGISLQALGMILSATMMGYIWTITVKLKTKLKPGKIAMFFGLGFAIGSHITWNVMVTYYASSFVALPFVFVLAIPTILVVPLVVILCVTSRMTKKE
jgi:membrane protease YdiL (CAAX protease family)